MVVTRLHEFTKAVAVFLPAILHGAASSLHPRQAVNGRLKPRCARPELAKNPGGGKLALPEFAYLPAQVTELPAQFLQRITVGQSQQGHQARAAQATSRSPRSPLGAARQQAPQAGHGRRGYPGAQEAQARQIQPGNIQPGDIQPPLARSRLAHEHRGFPLKASQCVQKTRY